MFFDSPLVANPSDEPYLLTRKGLPALPEHIGVANVKAIEDAIGIDPQNFLLGLSAHDIK